MTRLISFLVMLHFIWMLTVKAIPYHDTRTDEVLFSGAFLVEMTHRDGEIDTLNDALEVGASTALGAAGGLGLKTMLGTSIGVAGAGYAVDSTPMMTEGLVAAGLSGGLGVAAPVARRFNQTIKASGKTQTALSSSIPPEGCLLFRAQRIDETGKSVTVPVMIAGKARGNIAVPTQSPFLKEGVDGAMTAWKQVKEAQKALKGEYRAVKGHHVHAKKAFEGHVNYDPKKGFSISNQLMKDLNIDHLKVTGAQKTLFTKLAKSGRPNTIYEHTRVAVDALIEGGASRTTARKIVTESLQDLRLKNVRQPTNIPWNNK